MKRVWIGVLCAMLLAASAAPTAHAASLPAAGSGIRPCLIGRILCRQLGICPAATASPRPTASPTPAATPVPTAAVTPQPGIASEAATLFAYINEERTAAGLPALAYDAGLAAGALAHSRDMAQNGFFSHTSPTRGSFSARLSAAGLHTRGAAENIARYGSMEKAHAALMVSEGHRANILSAGFTHVGLGIVRTGNAYYITQWFARMDP